MKKLRFIKDGQDLYYTTDSFTIKDGLVIFTDKYGKFQEINKDFFFGASEVEQ